VRLDAVREPARALSGVRVLLVDDEAEIRLGMALVLEGEGAEVTAVGSAAEALKALEAAPARRKPHVLLSDIGLPGEDGYQLLDRVRAAEAVHGGEIPAVAVTAYAREVDRRRALDAGFQGHLAKPIEPDELIAAVAALVAGRPG
jgi:CheY-like chemotaxis protein